MRMVLEEIWKNILEINTVSDDDDFYQCNGDSLKLIKLFSSIYDEYEIEIDVAEYLEELTFGELLTVVEEMKKSENLC